MTLSTNRTSATGNWNYLETSLLAVRVFFLIFFANEMHNLNDINFKNDFLANNLDYKCTCREHFKYLVFNLNNFVKSKILKRLFCCYCKS